MGCVIVLLAIIALAVAWPLLLALGVGAAVLVHSLWLPLLLLLGVAAMVRGRTRKDRP